MKKFGCVFLIFILFVLNISPSFAQTENKPYQKFKYGLADFCNNKIVIKKGSVLKFTFLNELNAKNIKKGEEVKFILDKDIQTKDKNLVLPKGTIITSYIRDISQAESFNRNAKIFVIFKQIQLPDGNKYDLTARVHTRNGDLEPSKLLNAGRLTGEVGGAFVLASVAMTAAIVVLSPLALIGVVVFAPVAMLSGTILGVSAKGLNYSIRAGAPVSVELAEDLQINPTQVNPL